MAEPVAIKDVVIGDTVSFTLYGAGVIPAVTNGVVVGFTTGEALRDPVTATVHHANVLPTIPAAENEIMGDYTSYQYLTIRLAGGDIIEMGVPWIIPVSLTRSYRSTATLTLQDFNPSRRADLLELLKINGYSKVTMLVTEAAS